MSYGLSVAVAVGGFFSVYGLIAAVTINPSSSVAIEVPDRYTGHDGARDRLENAQARDQLRIELTARIDENSKLIVENGQLTAENNRLLQHLILQISAQNERLRASEGK